MSSVEFRCIESKMKILIKTCLLIMIVNVSGCWFWSFCHFQCVWMTLLEATAVCHVTTVLMEEHVICGKVAAIALMDGQVSSATRVRTDSTHTPDEFTFVNVSACENCQS